MYQNMDTYSGKNIPLVWCKNFNFAVQFSWLPLTWNPLVAQPEHGENDTD